MHDEFFVSGEEQGARLDVFLSRKEAALSRSQVQRAIDEGRVTVNRGKARASRKLKIGDNIRVEHREPSPCEVLAEDIPLVIIHEDPCLIVVDKPAGMVVHPAPGHLKGTLVNALLFHCRDLSGIGGVLRPGIVHRLDKDTSGLMIAAKSDEAHRGLADQFKKHLVRKTYKVLVWGDVKGDQGIIDLPVGRHPVDRKKMSTRSRRGKAALSLWRVCERYGMATLLDVDIETGRTHQIRVHLNALGYPVIGDATYGKSRPSAVMTDAVLARRIREMSRQALHAARIGFTHPVNGGDLSFSSPVPEDMAGLCRFLRERNP